MGRTNLLGKIAQNIERDALRYRFLRASHSPGVYLLDKAGQPDFRIFGDDLDFIIDNAIKELNEKERKP